MTSPGRMTSIRKSHKQTSRKFPFLLAIRCMAPRDRCANSGTQTGGHAGEAAIVRIYPTTDLQPIVGTIFSISR